MKKTALTLLLSCSAWLVSAQPGKSIDTLYFGSDGKTPPHRALADYYMIVPATADTCSRKPFRTCYMTGELRAEGGYIRLDSTDAHKTLYDGPWKEYYRSGRIRQQGTWNRGKRAGETYPLPRKRADRGACVLRRWTADRHAHLVPMRCLHPHGIRKRCARRRLLHLFRRPGLWGRYRLADDTPVFESPEPGEIREAYRDGEKWKYYNKDGLTVSMTGNRVREYGKYYRMKLG